MGSNNTLLTTAIFPVKGSILEPCQGRKAISLHAVTNSEDAISLPFQYNDNFGSLQGLWVDNKGITPCSITVQSTGQRISILPYQQGFVSVIGADSTNILVQALDASGALDIVIILLNYTCPNSLWVTVGGVSLIEVATHDMTSNNSPAPYVASENASWQGGIHPPWFAFSASEAASNDSWIGPMSTGVAWLQIDLGIAQGPLKGYRLLSHYWGQTCAPTAWQLQGSNDGTNFTVLDSRSGQNIFGANPYNFTLSSVPNLYRYYRLYITATGGATIGGGQAGAFVAVQQLYLYK